MILLSLLMSLLSNSAVNCESYGQMYPLKIAIEVENRLAVEDNLLILTADTFLGGRHVLYFDADIQGMDSEGIEFSISQVSADRSPVEYAASGTITLKNDGGQILFDVVPNIRHARHNYDLTDCAGKL